jgi:RNA-directed DNA polymerase
MDYIIKTTLDDVSSFGNLFAALQKAIRGKWKRSRNVMMFLLRFEEELLLLSEDVSSRTYRHGGYKSFYIMDPKKRLISAPVFRDRVVHHAVHDRILPEILPTFSACSHACLPGRGMHSAWRDFTKLLNDDHYGWILHGDIKKFFPSVNRGILKDLLGRVVTDEGLLWLLSEIIHSAEFIPHLGEAGIPIGNLTSQFFANFYLHELDSFITGILGIDAYIRYMDDFWIFGLSEDELRGIRSRIRVFLRERLDLTLHPEKSEIVRKRRAHMNVLCWQLYGKRRRVRMRIWNNMQKRLGKPVYEPEDYAAIGMYLGLLMPETVCSWEVESRE